MLHTISSREYSVAVMADLEGGFDLVWSKGAFTNNLKQEYITTYYQFSLAF